MQFRQGIPSLLMYDLGYHQECRQKIIRVIPFFPTLNSHCTTIYYSVTRACHLPVVSLGPVTSRFSSTDGSASLQYLCSPIKPMERRNSHIGNSDSNLSKTISHDELNMNEFITTCVSLLPFEVTFFLQNRQFYADM